MKHKLSLFTLAGLIVGGIANSPILISSATANPHDLWRFKERDERGELLRRDFEELREDEREENRALREGHMGEAWEAEMRRRQDLERIRRDALKRDGLVEHERMYRFYEKRD